MLNKSCEFQRTPGRRGAPSSPACLPRPGAPVPRHSHLQRTVGSIDKAKVLGFCQDHEGTLLMALGERDRGGGEADRLQSGSRADWREDKELYRLDNPDGRSRPLSSRADPPPSSSPAPDAALATTDPGRTLLQAKWRAVFLFSSSTVRSAFPRYSRNSARERGQRTDAFPRAAALAAPGPPGCVHFACHLQRLKYPKACLLLPEPRHRQGRPILQKPQGSSSLPHTAPTHPQQRSGRSRPPS